MSLVPRWPITLESVVDLADETLRCAGQSLPPRSTKSRSWCDWTEETIQLDPKRPRDASRAPQSMSGSTAGPPADRSGALAYQGHVGRGGVGSGVCARPPVSESGRSARATPGPSSRPLESDPRPLRQLTPNLLIPIHRDLALELLGVVHGPLGTAYVEGT